MNDVCIGYIWWLFSYSRTVCKKMPLYGPVGRIKSVQLHIVFIRMRNLLTLKFDHLKGKVYRCRVWLTYVKCQVYWCIYRQRDLDLWPYLHCTSLDTVFGGRYFVDTALVYQVWQSAHQLWCVLYLNFVRSIPLKYDYKMVMWLALAINVKNCSLYTS